MPLRTAVFVDGANFRGNLRDFSFRSSQDRPRYSLEERHFDWKSFFRAVLSKFDEATGWEHRLLRVHWYWPGSISPFPTDPVRSELAQRIASQHPEIRNFTPERVIDLVWNWYRNERSYFERLKEEVFERIQQETDFLEFKYVGQYQVHPFRAYRLEQDSSGKIDYLGAQVGEKGVDIGIAVDMIAKMPNFDAAILVSGDADFLPVVGYLKDNLKYVYQFSVARGVPPSIRYLSSYLKGMVDCFAFFDEAELLTKHLRRNSGIPSAILEAIDERVRDLTA